MGFNPTGLTGWQYNAVYQRVPVTVDNEFKILFYGLNNLYPQEVEQIRLASPLVKSSTEVLEDFLNGTGWESDGAEVVNRFGETFNDILNGVAKDASRFSGAFALHLNFNAKGRGLELQRVPFEYVRLSLPRADGRVYSVKVSDNWERSTAKRELKPKMYPLFNPMTAGEQTLKGGRGQILYFTGVENAQYPLASYDSIINTAITDCNIQEFEKGNTSKGFTGATIFKYPASIEGPAEEKKIKDKIDTLLGPKSSGALVVTVDEDFSQDLIETVEGLNVDDLFSTTLASTQDRVLQVFKQPPALMGIAPEGGVFTQLAYQESFVVYNVVTRNGRKAISRAIGKAAEVMGFNVGGIVENKFLVEGQELVQNGGQTTN